MYNIMGIYKDINFEIFLFIIYTALILMSIIILGIVINETNMNTPLKIFIWTLYAFYIVRLLALFLPKIPLPYKINKIIKIHPKYNNLMLWTNSLGIILFFFAALHTSNSTYRNILLGTFGTIYTIYVFFRVDDNPLDVFLNDISSQIKK